MSVRRYCTLPGPRRSRSRVHVTPNGGTEPGGPEDAAIVEMIAAASGWLLDKQERAGWEFMARRDWPAATGEYWVNHDGSRWEATGGGDLLHLWETRPEWATGLVSHPAELFPVRSPEHDAWEIVSGCERLRILMGAGAPAVELVEEAIRLGMVAGRARFEARFGRATDEGIKRLRIDEKAARESGNWELRERSSRWCDEVNEAVAGGRGQADVYREIAARERVPEGTIGSAVWRERKRRRERN
jgi:hypothetical protein